MLKDIVEELIETLSGIDGLRYVAEDWGQLDYEQPPVQWPCALIDIQNVRYGQIGCGGLKGDCTFTIQIANRPTQRTSAKATKAQQLQNLILFGVIDQIFEKIHAKEGDGHTPFVLKETDKANLQDLQSYILTFETGFKVERQPLQAVELQGVNISMEKKKTATPGGHGGNAKKGIVVGLTYGRTAGVAPSAVSAGPKPGN